MTEQMVEMQKAIAALALHLPAEVWEDAWDKWHDARASMIAEVEALREALTNEQRRYDELLAKVAPDLAAQHPRRP